jgi:threonylcarbamoyladenosine tRNA methylthiotransferase MtaB
MDKKPTIAVYTLGCRTNQFDSESIFAQFKKYGYLRVPEYSEADIHLVNTCTVTNKGNQKGRQLIRKLVRSNIGKVVVTGCSAQEDAQAIADLGVDLVVDNANKKNLYRHLEQLHQRIVSSPIRRIKSLEQTPIEQFGSKARAHLKIQDGCNQYCTYCIIPQVRGRSRSLKPEQLLSQLQKLINHGYKEIVLTGIHVGHYQYGDMRFSDILGRILEEPGEFRVRLSAIEPREVNSRVMDLFTRHPQKLCRHLHVAIQSASDSVLTGMKRRYNGAFLERLFLELSDIDPHFGIGTDVMVGFPGESHDEFQNTYDFIESSPINYGHVFRFSPKKGTPAADFPDQIPETIKKHRSEALRILLEKKHETFIKSQVGTVRNAVFETDKKGHTDNYLTVALIKNRVCPGDKLDISVLSGYSKSRNEKFPSVQAELVEI